MPELSHFDPTSAALLVMDYQGDILTRYLTAAQSADAIACVPDLIALARDSGIMVIHVVVAFRPGHHEVSPRNPLFSPLKANGMAVAGSEGAAIHPAAAAREGEPIVVKHRISPFVGTDLETLLRASGIDTPAIQKSYRNRAPAFLSILNIAPHCTKLRGPASRNQEGNNSPNCVPLRLKESECGHWQHP